MSMAGVLFAVTVMGGLILLFTRLRGMPRPPLWLALGHGALGVAGIVVLGAHWAELPPLALAALGVFALAALGGAALFVFFHLPGRDLPVALILGHGLIALLGLALLVAGLIQTFVAPTGEERAAAFRPAALVLLHAMTDPEECIERRTSWRTDKRGARRRRRRTPVPTAPPRFRVSG